MAKPWTVHSNGMGVQSVTIAAMSCLGDLPMPDVSIFADTGWEGPRTLAYAAWFSEWAASKGMKIVTVSVGNIRADALDAGRRWASMPLWTLGRDRRASMLKRQCTNEYKIVAVKREIRKRMELKPRQRVKEPVTVWLGISLDEVYRMKESRDKWIKFAWPLIDKRMDRRDCLAYLAKNGLEAPPKSACIGCPYRSDDSWREMKAQRPAEFEDACDFDERVRRVRPGVLSPVFLHRSLTPLRQVVFKNEPDMFAEECGGHCGL